MSNLYYIHANISGTAMWHIVYDKSPGMYFVQEDFEEDEYDIKAYLEDFPDNRVVEIPEIEELLGLLQLRLIEGLPPNKEQKDRELSLLAEIEQWKDATGLMDSSGDPDGVTPDDLRNEIDQLRQSQEKNWGIADEALCAEYEKKIQYERAACVRFLRECAKADRDYASRLLADTMQSKPQADRYEREAAKLEAVAEKIELGQHWK